MSRRVHPSAWALIACALLPAAAARAGDWSDLWQRPDQRAEQLLKSGQPAAAAPLFEDPRRRAYAEMQARDYAAAAKQLQGLEDPESAYNRGNALTRAGDLKAGLEAYESALQKAPRDGSLYRDALHNRDLVAAQLRSQQNKDQSKQGQKGQPGQQNQQGQQGQPGQQAGEGGQQEQNQSAQQGPAGQNSGQDAQKSAGQQGQQPGQQGQQPGQQGQQPGQQGQQPGQQPGQPAQQAGQQAQQPGQPAQQAGAASGADHDQTATAADARAAAQSQQQKSQQPNGSQAGQTGMQAAQQAQAAQGSPGAEDHAANPAVGAADGKKESEQQLALDQWLRWIPDDPAGLLRRKFMIEHMLKQQQESQQ